MGLKLGLCGTLSLSHVYELSSEVLVQHDLPLQHPNFSFVNCQRKTKYEEIIGDCVGFGHEGYQQLVPPYR
ncbi:hypothetical protein COP1_028231 [Malus domestica]